MALIKGITVTLFDDAGEAEDVKNVLVSPVSADAVVDEMNLTGRASVYELSIPKGDSHDWIEKRVAFWGKDWQTIGPVTEYMEHQVPLRWNRKIKVYRYG